MPEAETQPLADALHGAVLGEDLGRDTPEALVAGDLEEALQQLGAQALMLERVANEDRELSLIGSTSLAEPPDRDDRALPIPRIAVFHDACWTAMTSTLPPVSSRCMPSW